MQVSNELKQAKGEKVLADITPELLEGEEAWFITRASRWTVEYLVFTQVRILLLAPPNGMGRQGIHLAVPYAEVTAFEANAGKGKFSFTRGSGKQITLGVPKDDCPYLANLVEHAQSNPAPEALAQAAARLAERDDRAHRAYWASPVGQAALAAQRGDRFFQIDIPHTELSGYSNYMLGMGDVSKTNRLAGGTDILGQIETLGWRLEHAHWVFVTTGNSSRDKMLASGQKFTTSGRIEGIYLFRATPAEEGVDIYSAQPPVSVSRDRSRSTRADTTIFGG